MKDFIHSHKFSDLHDNHKIIYTRGTTHNILMAFNFIQSFQISKVFLTRTVCGSFGALNSSIDGFILANKYTNYLLFLLFFKIITRTFD